MPVRCYLVGPFSGSPFGVVPSQVVVDLDKRVDFSITLPMVAHEWSVVDGPEFGFVSGTGKHYAPLRMPSSPTATVQASNHGQLAVARATLVPSIPIATDCLGAGQPEAVILPGTFVSVESLPEPVVRLPPSYPDLAREADIDGTVQLDALVCACGEPVAVWVRVPVVFSPH